MARRTVSHPLVLAVLGCLVERPMHPYEMGATMRERGKHESVKLNYGSLYSVVQALQKHGLVAPRETVRDGRRPERTVYEVTPAGRLEFADWLAELLSTPEKEYPAFEAGLSLMAGLPPDDVVSLLEQRAVRDRSAGPGRGADRPAHHPLPGGGGPARRPAGHRRPRPGGGRGHA